jgi:alpha 1,3-glucosidase
MKKDGTVVRHRDVHSMYGSIMQRTTYRGMLARDEGKRRTFVLARSFFIGSQKYGPFWTGDNPTIHEFVLGSVDNMLSIGITGNFFGGADVPGYNGDPGQNLYIEFY